MLVVIDIGNTNITVGIHHEGKLAGNYHLTAKMRRTGNECGFMVVNSPNTPKVQPADIKDVTVSSAVSKIIHPFLNGIHKYIHREPILVGPGIKIGIFVKAENPKAVSADRITDTVGAYYEYGGPYLAVNYNTATTFDYVDVNGNFGYDVITLGTETGAQTMWVQATKLPEIEIKKPVSILAKTTTTGMQVGLVYGYTGRSGYIIRELREALGVDMKVIATSGLGKIIYRNTNKADVYDRNLTFGGLKYTYEEYTAEKKKQANTIKKFIP